MLSPADMLIIGAVALIAFGPDQLPKVARRAGQVLRDVQNTSQGFIREMERAADDLDEPPVPPTPAYGRIEEPRPAPDPFETHETHETHEKHEKHEKHEMHGPAHASKPASEFAHDESSGI